MLTHEENMLVTRTGPGTPMGETMRRYWIPALLSRNCLNRIARQYACNSWASSSWPFATRRENWPAGRILPAPPGLPVARAQ